MRKKNKKLENYDWYCDECNAFLNNQSGFNVDNGTWSCTECGELNYIDDKAILSDSEIRDFENSDFDSYNEYVNDKNFSKKTKLNNSLISHLVREIKFIFMKMDNKK